jgi:hypothetical protein
LRNGVRHLALSVAALWLVGECARAEPPAPPSEWTLAQAIEVSRGATCLDEQRLESQVQTWLGRSRVRSNVRVFVRGDAANPSSVEFRIARDGAVRYRRFDSLPFACDEATAAVGLAIALAIDANALREVVDPLLPRQPVKLFTLELGGGHEVVPGFSFGGAAGFELGFLDWLSARADVVGQYSFDDTIPGSPGRFDATLVFAVLRGCMGGSPTSPLRLALCGGFAAGVVHSDGQGFRVSQSATGEWMSLLGGLRVVLRAGIPWVLDVDMVVPVDAPSYRVDRGASGDLVRHPATAGVLFNVGPGLEF